MKLKVKVDEKQLLLIKQQLNIDMKIGIQKMAEKVIEGLYQIALMKKSGVNIDMDKIMKAGVEAAKDITREARKDESVKD